MNGPCGIRAVLSIRPGEGRRIAWLSLHSLLLGAFIAFYFSAANALFLARFDAAALPAAYVVSGMVGYLTVALLAPLERKLSSVSLAQSQLGFLIALVTALWAAAVMSGSRWTAFALFVAITPAFTVLNLEFWGLAGRLFDLRQGKRLFGLLGCGEVVSALLGYLLVPLILHFLDDPLILLPLAVAALAACMLIVRLMAGTFGCELHARREARPDAPRPRLATLGRNRYFLLIAGLIALSVIANYLVDFSFLSQVRLRFQGGEQVAGFIGIFFAAVKVIELAMRILAGRLLTRFGLRCGLAALPFTLLLCAAGAALAGLFAGTDGALFFLCVAVTKLVWLVLRKSLFDPSLRVLFQPLPEAERLAFQTRVEGLVQQSSTGLAGLLLLVLASSGATGALRLSGALLPVLAGWLALLGALHREYRARLLQNLSDFTDTGPAGGPSAGTGAWLIAPDALPPLPAMAPRALRELLEIAVSPATDGRAPAFSPDGLWDRDPGVQRRTLLAAGQTVAADYLPRILDHLAAPSLRAAAAHAAAAQGERALPHLETAFGRAGSPEIRVHLLRIYERIGGRRAEAFLLEQLEFPDRGVQLQALFSLSALGFCAAPEQQAPIKRRIEAVAEMTAWSMAAQLDLAGEPACAATRESLAQDLQGYRRSLFRLLSLLCDPRAVRLVRESLESGAGGAAVYALEILDILVPDDVKDLVLPLMEDLPPAQCLSRLEFFTVPARLDPPARLGAILHRERGVLSGWTKGCAAQALSEMARGSVPGELIANLFHPDPVLQETAAAAIHHIDPAVYARHARHLPAADQRRLDRIAVGAAGGAPALSAFARARFLRGMPPFSTLSRGSLLDLGSLAAERHLTAGEALPRTRGPAALHAVLGGGLESDSRSGGPGGAAAPGDLVLTGPEAPDLHALGPSHILTLEGDPLLGVLSRHAALVPAVLSSAAMVKAW